MTYAPLTIDFTVLRKHERSTLYGAWCRFLLRVQKRVPFLIYRDLTYEEQLNDQLKTRQEFPCREWERCFTRVEPIKKILKEVAEASARVNYYYTPHDLLVYVLWDDLEDDISEFMSLAVREHLGVECAPEDIVAMAKRNFTLERFFRSIR